MLRSASYQENLFFLRESFSLLPLSLQQNQGPVYIHDIGKHRKFSNSENLEICNIGKNQLFT